MDLPCIYVGCGKFSLQRLEILINSNQFTPIACVDIDIEKAKSDIVEDLVNKVLDKADTNYEEEEYYNEFDDDESEMEDLGFKFDDEKDDF